MNNLMHEKPKTKQWQIESQKVRFASGMKVGLTFRKKKINVIQNITN